MNYQESVLTFQSRGQEMLGILSIPPSGTLCGDTGIVIVVGGAQYRVGSHRQFVLLARHLAAAGYPVLRFDLPGMGDSTGEALPFEDISPEIGIAIQALTQARAGTRKVILWGLCDGATASLLYIEATRDPQVSGLALLNPWVRSDSSLARTQVKHYYIQRLLQGAFWRKLLQGQVGQEALRALARNLRLAATRPPRAQGNFQERIARAWKTFNAPVLLMLSENDLTAQEFTDHTQSHPEWRGLLQGETVQIHALRGADHTCSLPGNMDALKKATLDWLQSTHAVRAPTHDANGLPQT